MSIHDRNTSMFLTEFIVVLNYEVLNKDFI